MNLKEIERQLKEMATAMDGKVDDVHNAALSAQNKVFKLLIGEIEKFDISNGQYVTGQDYNNRFFYIQKRMQEIITNNYNPVVSEYLRYYNNIERDTINMHSAYNGIEVNKSIVTPTKETMYNQASYYLTQGLSDAYIQPAKFLMMQYVTKGSTIKELRSALENWNKGTLNAGELASDRHAPRLQAYSTQIARDTMYTYQGAVQDVIRKEYKLDKFIYVGGLVKDSRPFCKHLVSMRRKISFDEIPALVTQYPQGLKPDTTMKNFPLYRGGYNCNHTVMVVR